MMNTNRLTPQEVEKLQEANNLLASGLPERIERARKLIAEVLYSAAPTVVNSADGTTFTRTPPYWDDDNEGWD